MWTAVVDASYTSTIPVGMTGIEPQSIDQSLSLLLHRLLTTDSVIGGSRLCGLGDITVPRLGMRVTESVLGGSMSSRKPQNTPPPLTLAGSKGPPSGPTRWGW